ncbi:MAG: 50S ribosomal protein L15 [Bacteroidia bacterium]|nr:50S ribosomal protein L15 [Bacteroidia bacterium]
MDLSNLQPAEGAIKGRKRLGRGEGSKRGGTCTKGHNGAQSRSGYKRRKGFEGGQMPLQRRLPKFGFKNRNRVEYKVVNIATLQELTEKKKINAFNLEVFKANGLISKKSDLVKILGRGELSVKIEVTAHKFSGTAKEAIEAKGGKVETI